MIIPTFDKLTPQLIALTQKTGAAIMSFYKSDIKVEVKPDQTPLTIADQTAHTLIVEGLSKLTPDIPIVSEESNTVDFSQRCKWDEYWLIDPLDGTQDFLEQTGEFCICIAYIKQNQPIFGIIYAPQTRTHYYTTDRGAAYKLKNSQAKRITTNPQHAPLRVVIGHHSLRNEQLKSHLKQRQKYEIFQLGSALKFCLIAEGKYDYYPRFGPCSEWDTAAGVCILRKAGGKVVDENGKTLRYNCHTGLTSSVFFASGLPNHYPKP